MNVDQLKDGQRLLEIINTTRKGLEKLKQLKEKRKDTKDNKFDDGQYKLWIGEYSDGSEKAELTRYKGNAALLDVIILELEKQLAELEAEFELL